MTPPEVTRRIAGTLRNEQGLAALVAVILAMIVVAIIVLNFLAQTETKQYGSILTSTSTNALLTAEAGLRYTEKCLLQNDPACPAVTANADWLNLLTGFTLPFGSGKGQFAISFTLIDSNNVIVNSVGTFGASTREISKTVIQGGVCKLTENAFTSCLNPTIGGNTTITGTTEVGYCPVTPLVDPIVFPPDPLACPNASYPDFINDADPGAGETQFCQWTENKNNSTVILDGAVNPVMYIAGSFDMKKSTTLVINGDVTLHVGGDFKMRDTASIQVNGTLTLIIDGKMTLSKQSVINVVGGDPADVLALVSGNVKLDNDSIYIGGIISNGQVELKQNAAMTGAIVANMIKIRNNATLTHDPTAGTNSGSYLMCLP